MKILSRKEIAEETLAIIEIGEYRNNSAETVSIKNETDSAIENSKLFRPEDFTNEFDLTKIFDELLNEEFENCFERVIMAIYDRTQTKKVYNAFIEVFN